MSEIGDCQHPDTVICRTCGKSAVKTFKKVSANKRTVWANEFGDVWYGKKCPDCYKKYKMDYDEKFRLELGHRPLGSTSRCTECGSRVIVRKGSTRTCPQCNLKRLNKHKNLV